MFRTGARFCGNRRRRRRISPHVSLGRFPAETCGRGGPGAWQAGKPSNQSLTCEALAPVMRVWFLADRSSPSVRSFWVTEAIFSLMFLVFLSPIPLAPDYGVLVRDLGPEEGAMLTYYIFWHFLPKAPIRPSIMATSWKNGDITATLH